MIGLEAVSARRGDALVLDGITLSFGAEVVAVVGPSGSGKTTLLRVILGLQPPDAGVLRIGDRIASRDRDVDLLPEERNLGMVFQDLALWPHLSVQENLAFGLKARGIPKHERDRRVAETLESVALGAMADRAPGDLSGGERQRVAIARALVLDPVALLLDEPLANLDVASKDDLLGLLERIFAERALPVIYVTHDPREAARLAQHIVVLEGGRVTQDGALGDLEAAPATAFVEAFVRAARGS